MKRSGFYHTKVRLLARQMEIPHYAAVGILESLWHLCARETPAGNIGKLSNEAIALGIDWRGEPEALVGALLAAHWLDEDAQYRLLVHDWQEHCDNAVTKALQRKGLAALSGHVEKCLDMSRQRQTTADKKCLPLPLPLPLPEAKDICAETSSAPDPAPARDEYGHLIQMPTLTGSLWTVANADALLWAEAYPGLQVCHELRKAAAWLDANPKNRKTASGMKRFAVNWLARAQNSARPEYPNRGQPPREPYRPTEAERAELQRREDAQELESYKIWQSMGEKWRQANPWRGRRFDQEGGSDGATVSN
ncbi:MAG: hypothetical protein WCA44_17980 [Acidobacteriaceae bacterium]